MKQLSFFTTILFSLFTITGFSQEERETQDSDPGRLLVKTSRLFGKLVDETSQKGVESASVQLYRSNSNAGDSLVKGMLTKSNGDFSFTDISVAHYRVVISAIGYEEIEMIVDLSEQQMGNDKYFSKDLGNIVLIPAIKQLSNVTVTSTRPTLEMGVDRKVFNASKSIVAAGGTAIDLMKNIPTLSIDVEGNVQLRNSSPQIFVDGRPTILTLDQIPAENIEKVELITNPSAKFDAASSGGIINIVLKKNKRIGLNGIATIGGGTPGIGMGNLNLNMREGKINFYISGGYNVSGGIARSETERINKRDGVPTDYFNQFSDNERKRRFGSLRFGFDYFIDNRNTMSFTQHLGRGKFGYEEDQRQEYLTVSQQVLYNGRRMTIGDNRSSRNSSAVNFTHKFPKEGKELRIDLNYNYGNNRGASSIVNHFIYPDGTQYQTSTFVNNDNKGKNDQVTFQVDYANPLNSQSKIEAGVRSYFNDVSSQLNAYADISGTPLKLPLSNNYRYKEYVNAFYFTYSHKNEEETFSYQLGLRSEYSKFDGLMVDSAAKFGYEFPKDIKTLWNAFFPSLFVSKKIGDKDDIQFNFSRRIRRPNFWQINPYVDINDPANIRMGNPKLRPEFINSFEVNYVKNYSKGSFISSMYWRNNPDDITQYSDTITVQQYDDLKEAGINPDAILSTFINANTTNRYGLELVLQHKASENFEITPTFNLQYRKVNATVNNLDLSNDGFNWDFQLNTSYKFSAKNKSPFKNTSLQLTGEYESPRVIPQGRMKSQYSVDFALRKDILKEKGTFTFSINDILNSNRWGTIYDTKDFYQDSYRRWNVRSFRLTFSYRFGKADFSLLKRNDNRRGED